MSDVTNRIRSRAYWDVTIRFRTFISDRVSYAELDRLIFGLAVRLRGWPVPMVDYRMQILGGEDWVGQDIDAKMLSHLEAWRFWTSGQFSQLRVVGADWRVGPERFPVPDGYNGIIEVWEILFYLTEVFELAARLALSSAGDDRMVLSASLYGLENRGLVVGQSNRMEFDKPLPSRVAHQTQRVELTPDSLVAETRAEAAKFAREFFLRFGWQPALEQLLSHQGELDTEPRPL